MKATTIAIFDRVNDGSAESDALLNAINGFNYRKSTSSFPYITFFYVTGTPEYTMEDNKALEDELFQIDVWAESALEAEGIADKVEDVFNETTLNITGYDSVRCQKENRSSSYNDETGVEHLILEYRIWADEQ